MRLLEFSAVISNLGAKNKAKALSSTIHLLRAWYDHFWCDAAIQQPHLALEVPTQRLVRCSKVFFPLDSDPALKSCEIQWLSEINARWSAMFIQTKTVDWKVVMGWWVLHCFLLWANLSGLCTHRCFGTRLKLFCLLSKLERIFYRQLLASL